MTWHSWQEPGGLAEAQVGLREHAPAPEADLAGVGGAEDVSGGGSGQDAHADGHRGRAAETAHGQGRHKMSDEFAPPSLAFLSLDIDISIGISNVNLQVSERYYKSIFYFFVFCDKLVPSQIQPSAEDAQLRGGGARQRQQRC